MRIALDLNSLDSYRTFLAVKSLPKYRFVGREAEFDDEYADRLGLSLKRSNSSAYTPPPWMFDYQRDITSLAIRKRKFAVFADPGLGKTLIASEVARYAVENMTDNCCALIVSPLMVVRQTLSEVRKFYGDSLPIEQVSARDLGAWTTGRRKHRIGITNYEAMRKDVPQGDIGCLIADEGSMLKSHYGKWGGEVIRLGKGVEWKLILTGTPAPNDRIEYANHAVFLDAFPTVNAFLARFFVNRGQTDNRWELKSHALPAFYRALSHWCIFLTDPATYGWKDNAGGFPPINVHIHDVDMTDEQHEAVVMLGGNLFGQAGGITSRSKLGQIAKGHHKGKTFATNKPAYIRKLVDSWPEESTIIWCLFNAEQDTISSQFPDAANIDGSTHYEEREVLLDDFLSRRRKILISKPKVMGFGLNLQVATRQVFSGLQDSYESFYQAVKRSNRYGSTQPLNVHIPITEVERPMIDTVLAKARRVQTDAETQERIFKEFGYDVA